MFGRYPDSGQRRAGGIPESRRAQWRCGARGGTVLERQVADIAGSRGGIVDRGCRGAARPVARAWTAGGPARRHL
jgi:hypothetical protein